MDLSQFQTVCAVCLLTIWYWMNSNRNTPKFTITGFVCLLTLWCHRWVQSGFRGVFPDPTSDCKDSTEEYVFVSWLFFVTAAHVLPWTAAVASGVSFNSELENKHTKLLIDRCRWKTPATCQLVNICMNCPPHSCHTVFQAIRNVIHPCGV